MQIGVVPRRVHFELRKSRRDLAFIEFRSATSWSIDGIQVPKSPTKFGNLSSFAEVLERLYRLSPIFSRFGSSLPKLDLAFRDLALQVIALAEALQEKSIKVVLMGTASSHHIETQILEIASQLSCIPQVFEYYLPSAQAEAIPLIQTAGIDSRTVFPYDHVEKWQSEFLDSLDDGWTAPFSVSLYSSIVYQYTFNYPLAAALVSLGYITRNMGKNGSYERRNDELLGSVTLKDDLRSLSDHSRASKKLSHFESQDILEVKNLLESRSQDTPIICIFAHFQPEATTFPEGGEAHNHVDLVSKVRALGYRDKILYLEHPAIKGFSQGIKSQRVGIARSLSYYDSLRSLGCLFVRRGDITPLPSSIIPLTMTGSIGLERSLVGKSTIVTGHPWYRGIPGTLHLSDAIQYLANSTSLFDPEISHNYIRNLLHKKSFSADPLIYGTSSHYFANGWKTMYQSFLDSCLRLVELKWPV